MDANPVALFRRFPDLVGRIPHLPLCRFPTPVQRLTRAGPALGIPELWVKRDDLCHAAHGGSKARKLEFALGAARAQQAGVIVSGGATGSNWAAALCFHAPTIGLPVRLILWPRPLSAVGIANDRYMRAHAEHVTTMPSVLLLPWVRWRELTAQRARRPCWLPAGGTTPQTSLAFVSAALELAEQIRAGELPAPDVVVATLGSAGALGGLWAGLRLAGLAVELVGVRVVDRILSNGWAARRIGRQCLRLLGEDAPATDVRLTVCHEAFGAGYARTTPAAERAMAVMRETEGLALDGVYTAKCVAGMQALAARGAFAGRRVLYWHTLPQVAVAEPERE